MTELVPWLVLSYLLGAVPTSYLAGRIFRGIDLRQHGSGNLGATNLYRTLGWKYAVPVGLLDIAKGVIPVVLFAPQVSASQRVAAACGVAAVIGHVYSIFVRFKGGKGVATAAGVMLGLAPLAIAVLLIVWAAVVFATGYVSLGSVVAASLLPLAVWVLHPGARALLPVVALVAAGVVWLHRANIRRLLGGTENRFGRRKTVTPPAP
ncbi:MAG TPA: glycerol-3-phosphate 1-O-acyltransferase PlsY [Gemmatimonadales bacterium]|nr:glycerol-3-phosphate 1-O-acyltransferase PlsY [Gemmatimonadales bacterium]